MVAISVFFGFFAQDVNSVLQWIVSALWGAYVVSNMLKWYWWRFNGSGFFWGMFAGIISALICSRIFDFLDLYYFPIILVISALAAIMGTYLKPPTDEETLKTFYKNVKPWGFWKPIHDKVVAEDPTFKRNRDFWRDMFNIVVGIIAPDRPGDLSDLPCAEKNAAPGNITGHHSDLFYHHEEEPGGTDFRMKIARRMNEEHADI